MAADRKKRPLGDAVSFANAFAGTVTMLRRGSALWRAGALLLRSAPALVVAMVALASLVALLGDDPGATGRFTSFVQAVGPSGSAATIQRPVADAFANDGAAILCLVTATAWLAWCAFAYGHSFSSAVASIEGSEAPRPRPGPFQALLGVTVGALVAAVAAALVLTGHVARAAIDATGGTDRALALWNAGKWPLVAGIYVLLFLILSKRAARSERAARPLISVSQAGALVVWAVVLAGFTFYIANFGSFDQAYGSPGATAVSLMWLILFSLLYYVTPTIRIESFGAVLPGLALSLAAWLAASAGLTAYVAATDPFRSASGAIGLAAVTLGWLWISNLALLLGVSLNLELARRLGPVPYHGEPAEPSVEETELEWIVRGALEDDSAHHGMWSALSGTPEEVPMLLTELECDLNDWGFTYGVAWAIAKRRYPLEPDDQIAERALKAARAVFGEYCAGEDWSCRLADRRLAGNVPSEP